MKPHIRYYGGFWRCALPSQASRDYCTFPWGHGSTAAASYDAWQALMRLRKGSMGTTLPPRQLELPFPPT